MGLMDKHIGLAVKKRVKFQIVVAKNTVHVLSAAAADEQYAQLRGFVHDLLNDLRALPYQKFIGIGFLLIDVVILRTTVTLAQGVPLETVSKMLGHKRITTTQIYAKITNDKIGQDMAALSERLDSVFKIAQ